MLNIRLVGRGRELAVARVVGLPVTADGLVATEFPIDGSLRGEIEAFLRDAAHSGKAGTVHSLPRPGRRPQRIVLVGIGAGTESDWRSAGAALVRKELEKVPTLTVAAPAEAVRGLAEGAWLAGYRFRPDPEQKLNKLNLVLDEPAAAEPALAEARAVADATLFARDLTNTPSLTKTPAWFADRIVKAATPYPGLRVTVRDQVELAARGFGGILAVGQGSDRPPRLVEMSWRPRGATRHVVLVGKGITFDTGGISIKPKESMRLMRKDMGGAAAVTSAALGAAAMRLPVRVTALAPLAENMVSGKATRPGDVVTHYGGLTSEIQNTDAEGRVVLGDALAYAVARLKPDVIVDLATLTGAQSVALGKRTAALFTEDDDLAKALVQAGEESGEPMWRLPLIEEYHDLLKSDVADLTNAPAPGSAGAVMAALYLREFTGNLHAHWAHIDMSGPSWVESADGELAKGATGWGVRTLLRWLSAL